MGTKPKPPGRPTKLTHRVSALVLESLENGATFTQAARDAGISRDCLMKWLRDGRDGNDAAKLAFYDACCDAIETWRKARIKAYPRSIRRAVSERHESDNEITARVYDEMCRLFDDGRVPVDIRRAVCEMAMADIEDREANQRISWEQESRN